MLLAFPFWIALAFAIGKKSLGNVDSVICTTSLLPLMVWVGAIHPTIVTTLPLFRAYRSMPVPLYDSKYDENGSCTQVVSPLLIEPVMLYPQTINDTSNGRYAPAGQFDSLDPRIYL